MAIDTPTKRFSFMEFNRPVGPHVPFPPDGLIDNGDRNTFLRLYSGVVPLSGGTPDPGVTPPRNAAFDFSDCLFGNDFVTTEVGTLAQAGVWDNLATGTYLENSDPQANDARQLYAVFRFTGFNPAVRHNYRCAVLQIGIKNVNPIDVGTVFTVYVRRFQDPASWSDSVTPFALFAGAGIVQTFETIGQGIADNRLIEAGSFTLREVNPPLPLQIELRPEAFSAASQFDGYDENGVITADSMWTGEFSLEIHARRPENSMGAIFHGDGDTDPASLTMISDLRRITGMSTPRDALGRVAECPICGFTSLRDDWVRDPRTRRYVCTKNRCADFEDMDIEHPLGGGERPPINED